MEKLNSTNNKLLKYKSFKNEYQHSLDLQNAIQKCKEWSEHRKWLIKNNIEVKSFKEETEFQESIERF